MQFYAFSFIVLQLARLHVYIVFCFVATYFVFQSICVCICQYSQLHSLMEERGQAKCVELKFNQLTILNWSIIQLATGTTSFLKDWSCFVILHHCIVSFTSSSNTPTTRWQVLLTHNYSELHAARRKTLHVIPVRCSYVTCTGVSYQYK